MLLPILLFALVLCAGLTFGLALTVSRRERRDMEQRLRLLPSVSASVETETDSRASAKPPTEGLQLERLLLVDRDHPWDLKINPTKLAIAAIAAAVATSFAFNNLLQLPIALSGAAACVSAYLAMRIVVIRERGVMETTFSALFPDAVDAVARMLRAGLPVTSAFQMVCQEAPPPVDAVFAKLAGQLRIGMSIEDLLRLSSQRIRVPDFQFFAVAVVLQQSAGGNLLPTLESLAQMMRNRRATQMKARAATAEVRFSAYVLGALPFVTVGALLVVSPGYLTPLFHDPRGKTILAAASAGLLISGLVMRQMMRSVEQP